MHELLLSILTFCPATLAERQDFTVCYDTANQRAFWTSHTPKPSTAPVTRKHWRKDHELNSLPSAAFTNSGFDRGHLASAADLPNSTDTFLTSNAVPQNPKLNRGEWRRLENQIRKLRATHVITGAKMGAFASPRLLATTAWVTAALIITLNVKLLYDFMAT